ncbi:MAG: hypothetical protein ACOVP7_11775, partial [Lacibacter sp.]
SYFYVCSSLNAFYYIEACSKWGLTEEQSADLQSQAVVRAGQATFNFAFKLQQINFIQQRLWADGILISQLLQYSIVTRKRMATILTN